MEVKVPTNNSINSTNYDGNEAEYLLCNTTSWQREEEMASSFTKQYLSSVSFVETIKIEGEEIENFHTLVKMGICDEIIITPNEKVTNVKKEDVIHGNLHIDETVFEVEHIKKKHFPCDQCEKIFTRKSCLKRHMLIHKCIKGFACDQCEKGFTQKHHLIQHKLIHEGIKSFACDQCDERFTQKGGLKRHKLNHEDIKAFTCDHCEKRFTQKGDLNKHKLIHEDIKSFTCDQCEKRFRRKGHLNQHKLTHKDT